MALVLIIFLQFRIATAQSCSPLDSMAVAFDGGFILDVDKNEGTGSRAALSAIVDLRKVLQRCGSKDLTDGYQKIYGREFPDKFRSLTTRAGLDAASKNIVDDVLTELQDSKSEPYGDLNGDLGKTKRTLEAEFNLTRVQRDRLQNIVKQIARRTKSYFHDIDRSCPPINLNTSVGGSEDQKNSSLCFAFGFAANLNKILASQIKKGERISAAWIALQSELADHEDAVRKHKYDIFANGPTSGIGGEFQQTFDAVAKSGVCLESQVSDQIVTIDGTIHSIEDYQKLFPKLTRKQIEASLSPDNWTTVKALMSLACPQPIPLTNIMGRFDKAKKLGSGIDILSAIQRALFNGEITIMATSPLWGHAMLIVGEKRNLQTGSCEFKVRNSYGDDCGKSHKDSPKFMIDTCDGKGNFTAAPAVLIEHLYEIFLMERKSSSDLDPAKSRQ
jgi:hypothetical protein